MKAYYYVELNNGEKYDLSRCEDYAKAAWKEEGRLVKDISSIQFYVKPEEKACYYVINDEIKGNFEL